MRTSANKSALRALMRGVATLMRFKEWELRGRFNKRSAWSYNAVNMLGREATMLFKETAKLFRSDDVESLLQYDGYFPYNETDLEYENAMLRIKCKALQDDLDFFLLKLSELYPKEKLPELFEE